MPSPHPFLGPELFLGVTDLYPVTGCSHTLLGVRFSQLESGVATCLLMAGGGYSGTRVEGRGLGWGRSFHANASSGGGGGWLLVGGRMSGIPLGCREL